jgi:hypothetical protein
MLIIFPVIKRGKGTRRNYQPMRSRAFRPIAAILAVLLLAGTPAHAGPVALNEVLQVIGAHQNPPDLRLRSSRYDGTLASGNVGSSLVDSSAPDTGISNTSSSGVETSDSLLAGVASSDNPQGAVDVIDQGDLEGTICDCGEITESHHHFPKWPLLFLAAIPFFFIHHCDNCEKPPSSPPGTPEIPEPASLLLFGSGLAAFGAGLRRRYAKAKLAAQLTAQTGGQFTEEV